MDPAGLAARIEAIEGRLAGTDAERRAALLCARELREAGRRPRTQTLWFRRQRMFPRAVEAAVGVAASIVAASHPAVGLGLAGGALLAAILETAHVPVASLLMSRRATQNVIAAAPDEDAARVLVVVTAGVDAPRDSVLERIDAALMLRGGWPRFAPGPPAVHLIALALIAGFAGARLAGASGTALGAGQLVPSVVLILLVGAFLDAAAGHVAANAPASGAAVAVAVAATLDAAPPRDLDVEVLIAGAACAGAPGMRAYVRSRRRTLAPEDIVVLHLRSATGPPRIVVRDGELTGTRLHPRLAELAASAAGTGALVEGRGLSGARAARAAGWPALALEGEPRPLAELVLRLIAAIDDEVGARRAG